MHSGVAGRLTGPCPEPRGARGVESGGPDGDRGPGSLYGFDCRQYNGWGMGVFGEAYYTSWAEHEGHHE